MLKVIVYSAQSALGLTPMLYHIVHNSREILFIQTGTIGGIIVHFVNQERKPKEKFIQLKRFTGEFSFVDSIGTDGQSIYVPILELESSTLRFPPWYLLSTNSLSWCKASKFEIPSYEKVIERKIITTVKQYEELLVHIDQLDNTLIPLRRTILQYRWLNCFYRSKARAVCPLIQDLQGGKTTCESVIIR